MLLPLNPTEVASESDVCNEECRIRWWCGRRNPSSLLEYVADVYGRNRIEIVYGICSAVSPSWVSVVRDSISDVLINAERRHWNRSECLIEHRDGVVSIMDMWVTYSPSTNLTDFVAKVALFVHFRCLNNVQISSLHFVHGERLPYKSASSIKLSNRNGLNSSYLAPGAAPAG